MNIRAERVYLRIMPYVLWDMVFSLLLVLLPILVHTFSVPLYVIEPMRIVLLANLLVVKDSKNSYIMALALPLISCAVGGHPYILKAVLMSIELSANVLFFDILSTRVKYMAGAMFISIIASKAIYYLMKYCILSFGLMDGPLVATGLLTQLIVAVVISFGFWKFQKRRTGLF